MVWGFAFCVVCGHRTALELQRFKYHALRSHYQVAIIKYRQRCLNVLDVLEVLDVLDVCVIYIRENGTQSHVDFSR